MRRAQAFGNLVESACRFTAPERHVAVRVRVEGGEAVDQHLVEPVEPRKLDELLARGRG